MGQEPFNVRKRIAAALSFGWQMFSVRHLRYPGIERLSHRVCIYRFMHLKPTRNQVSDNPSKVHMELVGPRLSRTDLNDSKIHPTAIVSQAVWRLAVCMRHRDLGNPSGGCHQNLQSLSTVNGRSGSVSQLEAIAEPARGGNVTWNGLSADYRSVPSRIVQFKLSQGLP